MKMSRVTGERIEGRAARAAETLTFIRTQYTAEQQVRAADLIMELAAIVAYADGLRQPEAAGR